MKICLMLAVLVVSAEAQAIRCKDKLIDIGDPAHTVIQHCKVLNTYDIKGFYADVSVLFVQDGDWVQKVSVIDGRITAIEQTMP